MLEPSQLACLRKRKLLLRQPAQATRNASSVSSVRRITNWIFVLSSKKTPYRKKKACSSQCTLLGMPQVAQFV